MQVCDVFALPEGVLLDLSREILCMVQRKCKGKSQAVLESVAEVDALFFFSVVLIFRRRRGAGYGRCFAHCRAEVR